MLDVEEKPGDDAGEIGGGPVAVHEGFGETDVAGEDAFAEEGGAADAEVGGGGETGGHAAGEGVGAGAELDETALGEIEAEVTELHLAERGEHHAAAERAAVGGGSEVGGGGVEGGGIFVAHGVRDSGWWREREACGR